MPRVSVVIAAYNVESCLARTVDSVLAQKLQDFEILIVDDGSADRTAAVAQRVAAEDPRIRVFSLPRNQGPAAARNRGLAEARGEWAAILDADDVLLPDRLMHLVEMAQRRCADIVADDIVPYDFGADRYLQPAFGWTREHALTLDAALAASARMEGYPIGWIQPLWRVAFLRENGLSYPVQHRYMEDLFLLVSALVRGAKLWLSPRAEYVYTLRHGPISEQGSPFSRTRISGDDRVAAIDGLLERYRDDLLPHQARALRTFRRRLLTHVAMTEAIRIRREEGLPMALRMLGKHPAAAWGLFVGKFRNLLTSLRREKLRTLGPSR